MCSREAVEQLLKVVHRIGMMWGPGDKLTCPRVIPLMLDSNSNPGNLLEYLPRVGVSLLLGPLESDGSIVSLAF